MDMTTEHELKQTIEQVEVDQSLRHIYQGDGSPE